MTGRTTILFVEDNAVTRKLVRYALERAGHDVLEASDGATAVAQMSAGAPDLVLQDLVLPDIDGFELATRLRGLPGGSNVPLLALSGLLSLEDETRVAAVGFDELIAKPVEPSRLVQIVRAHLPAAAGERFGAGRRVLVVDDDPLQRKLLAFRLAQHGFATETAADGLEALERARAAPPDAIVSDALMPRLDGFGLTLAVRRDPRLATVPLVLATSSYVEEIDRQLAQQAGATAFVVRAPDLREVVEALRASLARAPRTPPADGRASAAPADLEQQLSGRAIKQLERQVALNTGLARRCAMLSAELSVLTSIAGSLARAGGSGGDTLRDILLGCLDAAGASRGAIYLFGPGDAVTVSCAHGFAPELAARLPDFFGHRAALLRAGRGAAVVALPSDAVPEAVSAEVLASVGAPAALLVPLAFGGEVLGALLLGAPPRRMRGEDWASFGAAVGTQISVALALSRTFARLAASEQRRRALMEHAQDAIFVSDDAAVVLEANDAAERLLARPRDAIVGRALLEFAAARDRPAIAEQFALACRGGVARRQELAVERPDGAAVPVELSVSRVQVDGATLCLWIVRDVTDRHALAEQLRQAQKMEAVGRLAGGVAHDFNNLLVVILSYAELLLRDLPPEDATRREDVGEIRHAAERAADLTRQLLAFSRRQVLQPAVIDPNAVVAELERMLRRVLPEHVVLATDLGRGLGSVRADRGQLEQVIMNLAVNARDAMPHGGRLTIGTRSAELAAGSAVCVRHQLSPGPYAVLSVADTGIGMDVETLSRVFEPFFTTKPVGRGTGLGLATVHGIVQQSGGAIEAASEPGRGTTFTVYLPRDTGAPGAAPQVTVPPPRRTGREAILLVEDDPSVRTVAARILREQGYRVVAATDGEDAERIFAAHGPFDLVLTDVVLPKLGGLALATRLTEARPQTRVLFMSGYAGGVDDVAQLRAHAAFLEKPFSPESLAHKVREALDQPIPAPSAPGRERATDGS